MYNRTIQIKFHGKGEDREADKVYGDVFNLMVNLAEKYGFHFMIEEIDNDPPYKGRDWASSDDMWPEAVSEVESATIKTCLPSTQS